MLTWLMPARVLAAWDDAPPWVSKLIVQLSDPWCWFGLSSQGLFFLRFVWQWIVSERRKRSTVPVGFWYLSLAGAISLFIYGCHQLDLVIMAGPIISSVIYVRNLMLIHGRAARRRRAGLPTRKPAPANGDEGVVENGM